MRRPASGIGVYDTKAEIWASPYWADGKVYLGTSDGDLLVFAHGRVPSVLEKSGRGQGHQSDGGRRQRRALRRDRGVFYLRLAGREPPWISRLFLG